MSLHYWLLVLLLGIGWGSSIFFNEILVREMGPLTVSVLRVGLGAIGCWIWVLATGRQQQVNRLLLGQFLVLGIFQYALPFAIFPAAQQYITSGAAGIINALTPIMVVIVSHIWPGGERATFWKSLGVLFGFAGILFLANPALRDGAGSEFWAILFCMLAPCCYAVAINWVRRLKAIDPAITSAWSLTAGCLFLAPFALMREGVPVITRAETWAALLFVGFILTAASFILLFWLIPRIGGTNASTVTFITPVSAVLLGVWFLGETVLPEHLIGMAAIFVGLILIDGRLVRWARRSGGG